MWQPQSLCGSIGNGKDAIGLNQQRNSGQCDSRRLCQHRVGLESEQQHHRRQESDDGNGLERCEEAIQS